MAPGKTRRLVQISLMTVLLGLLAVVVFGCAPEGEPLEITYTAISETATTASTQITGTYNPTISSTSSSTSMMTLTPSLDVTDSFDIYTLRAWSEHEALELIEEINEQISNLIEDSNCSFYFECHELRQEINKLHEALFLLVQETLFRFPDLPEKTKLEWQMVLSSLIQYKLSTTDDLMEKILEEGLNSGRIDLYQLNDELNLIGFNIKKHEIVNTSSGEWQNTHLFLIASQEDAIGKIILSGDPGMLIAIRENGTNKFDMIPIDNKWVYGSSNRFDFSIKELTGDNVPEIITELESYGGLGDLRINIFQWKVDQYQSIFPSQKEIGLNNENYATWQITDEDVVDLPGFIFSESNMVPSHTMTETYQWDGEEMSLIETSYSPYYQYSGCIHWGDLDYLGLYDPQTQINIIHKCLSSWPSNADDYFGPSFFDYLRFYMGMLHLSQSQESQAIEVLQSLVVQPKNPEILVIPRAAEEYLDTYSNPGSQYHACGEAISVFDQVVANRDEPLSFGEEPWGYRFPNSLPPFGCDENSALIASIEYLNTTQVFQPWIITDFQDQLDLSFVDSIKLDIDDNGFEDLFAIIPSNDYFKYYKELVLFNCWLFLNYENEIVPLDLGQFYLDVGLELPQLQLSSYYRMQDESPIHVLGYADKLKVLLPTSDLENGKLEIIFETDNLINYSIEQTNEDFEIIAFYDTETKNTLRYKIQNEWLSIGWISEQIYGAVFRWDESVNRFILANRLSTNSLGIPLDDVAERAESQIFDDSNVFDVVQPLKVIISEHDTENMGYPVPKIYYLLGLAYELLDDESNAVETYFQLWQAYPDSPYSLFAEKKLIERSSIPMQSVEPTRTMMPIP